MARNYSHRMMAGTPEPPQQRTRLYFPPRYVIKVPDMSPILVPGWPPIEVPYSSHGRRLGDRRCCLHAPMDSWRGRSDSRPQFHNPPQFHDSSESYGSVQFDGRQYYRQRQQFDGRSQFYSRSQLDSGPQFDRRPHAAPLNIPKYRDVRPNPPRQRPIPPQARQPDPFDDIGPATPLNRPRELPSATPQQRSRSPPARPPDLSPQTLPTSPLTPQTSPRPPFQWPTPPATEPSALSPGEPEARALEGTAEGPQSSSETSAVLGPPDPYVGSCAVVGLTKTTFRKFIRGLDAAFVLFYDPCEKNCAWAKQNMRQAAVSTHRSNHAFAAVDCTKECHLCEKQGVKSYPTMKLYAKGKPVNTFTDRDMLASRDITKFVENISAYTNIKFDKKKCVIQ